VTALSFLQPDLPRDPYPHYSRLREAAPVLWDPDFPGGAWIVTGYAEVAAAARDARLSSDRVVVYRTALKDTEPARALVDSLSRMMILNDPPDHTRLRGLVNKAFTPSRVASLRARVANIAESLIDAAQKRGEMELIRDFAYPLPAAVICEMLGLPVEDQDQLKVWADDMAAFMGAVAGKKRVVVSHAELIGYLRKRFVQRRADPRDDLLSALVAAEEDGASLSAEELAANVVLLFMAGHHTTMNLIGNGLLALLRHPDQMARVRGDPLLWGPAVEELLRYDCPVQFMTRVASERIELGGKTIEPGQLVHLVIGAANRDPAQFSDPDTLKLDRTENRHLSFGYGAHFCVGAALARLEAPIAFTALFKRLPDLHVAANELEWHENPTLRGLKSLPIAFT
jgi:cytochrome P450